MLNEIYDNPQRIPIAVPVGVVSGDPVAIGSLIGVAQINRNAAGITTIATEGVFELTITGAITLGAPVYAVVAADLVTSLTATVGSNVRFGTCLSAQGSTGKMPVMLRQP